MAKNINEMTMTEIRERAIELGFKIRQEKKELLYFHWNSSQECKAYEYVKKFDPELTESEDCDDFPDDAA